MTSTVIAARIPEALAARARTVAGPGRLSAWLTMLVIAALDAQNDNATGGDRGGVTHEVGTDEKIPSEGVGGKPPDTTTKG